jgi:hypothetical protein
MTPRGQLTRLDRIEDRMEGAAPQLPAGAERVLVFLPVKDGDAPPPVAQQLAEGRQIIFYSPEDAEDAPGEPEQESEV